MEAEADEDIPRRDEMLRENVPADPQSRRLILCPNNPAYDRAPVRSQQEQPRLLAIPELANRATNKSDALTCRAREKGLIFQDCASR